MFETRSEKGVMELVVSALSELFLWLLLLLLILTSHLAACHPWTEKANDNFYCLQLQFVINILQNQFQLDPRSLKRIILGYPKGTPVW